MNEKFKELYSYLKSKNMTDLDENTFYKKYSNPAKSKEIHSYLKSSNMTDLDEDAFHSAYFGGSLKKKEPTVSRSQSEQEPSSSVVPPKRRQSSLGSTIKREGDVFSGLKGKEDKKYRLDNSTGRPVWIEQLESKDSNGKKITALNEKTGQLEPVYYESIIQNPSRVRTLNKVFNQNASTSPHEKIFTGFPGKETNEYRIVNGVWQRRAPKEKEFRDIYNAGAIEGLNKQFGQDVKISSARSKYAAFTEDVDTKEKQDLNNKANQVATSKLIDKEEGEVLNTLRKEFPNFKFLPGEGALVDDIKVIAPNDNSISISLDNFTSEDDSKEARNLREFIKNNSDKKVAESIQRLNELERIPKGWRYAEYGDPEYVPDSPSGQMLVPDIGPRSKEEIEHIKKYGAFVPFKDPEREKAIKQERENLMKASARSFIDVYEREKKANETGTPSDDKDVIAAYAALKHDDLTIKRTNDYANDVKEQAQLFAKSKKEAEAYSQDIINKVKTGEITKEDFEANYLPKMEEITNNLKEQSKSLVDDITNMSTMQTSVNESVAKNYLIQEAKGTFGGGMSYKFVKGLTYLPRLFSGNMSAREQDDLVRSIVGGGTTKEYMESEERSDIVKAMLSLSESIGTMVSAAPAAALGAGSTALIPAFYAQSYYEMKDELDQVEGMSDLEKVLYSGAYGAVSSALEKFGIDFISQKTQLGKKLTKNIMMTVFSDLPKDASKEFIDAAIMNSTKKYLTELGIKTVGGAFVEGTTEGLQKLSDIGIKWIYDKANSKNYFNNKSAKEIWGEVAYESYLGALGGAIMSSAHSSKDAVARGVRASMNKEQIEALVNAAQVEGMDTALLTNLKASMLSGKISRQDAKDTIDSFNIVRSKVQSMTPEMTTEQKSVALDLMLEQDRINKEIQGKDPNLVVPQKKRLAEIEQQLKKIGEDAVTESNIEEQEVSTESNIIQREGVDGGQQEVGQGEGSQRETAQPETNLGDSNIPSQETVTPGFNQPVEAVRQTAEEYKAKLAEEARQRNEKSVKRTAQKPVGKLVEKVSEMMAEAYEKVKHQPRAQKIKKAYDAMVKETVDQYDFLRSKGLQVERFEGEGEPYANSNEMLADIRDNNHLYFLPNEEAFGTGNVPKGNIALQPSGRKLDDGYEMTNSEVFRVVHDYFGHGILGNQFGAIGEENAALQHLDMYSDEAAPAVIYQTRGQNSWVNFSKANAQAKQMFADAKKLRAEGKTEEADAMVAEAQKIFKFAEPKVGIFPNVFNFRKYETARRINEQSEIDKRANPTNREVSEILVEYSERSRNERGVSRRDLRETKRLGGLNVEVVAEYTLDDKIDSGIKAAFPTFKGVQKIFEIKSGEQFRDLMIRSLKNNKFKASVTVHSVEDFNGMRMFVTEDGSTGITLDSEGFLGGGFSDPQAGRPNNISQLIILGIKEGAITAECFDTALSDYYSFFGFKAVSRTEFNDDVKIKPMIENGALADWDYDTYKDFNNGRPDVVFMIYDGGNRATIEDRIGDFDLYKNYEKGNIKLFDKDSYEKARNYMNLQAAKRMQYESEVATQEEAVVEEEAVAEETLDDLLELDTKEKTNLEKVSDILTRADEYLSSQLTQGQLNDVTRVLPLVTMQKVIRMANRLVKTGMTLQKAIAVAATKVGVTKQEALNAVRFMTELMSKPAPKKVLVDPFSALKREYRAAEKAFREGKYDLKQKRKMLNDAIKAMTQKGNITLDKARVMIDRINSVNLDNPDAIQKLLDYTEKVFGKAEEKLIKERKTSIINKIVDLVNKKAKPAMTSTGKRRSKGIDAEGQAFFSALKPILKAAVDNDTDAMVQFAQELSDVDAIDEVLAKEMRGEKLTSQENALLNKVMAFDMFADILNMDIDQLENLYEDLETARATSMANLKAKRGAILNEYQQTADEATGTVRDSFGVLFNEDGSPKDANQLAQDQAQIWNSFKELKIWDGIKKFLERRDFQTVTGIYEYFRNRLAHIESLTKILDKKGTFFTDNIYRPLNKMDEASKRGYFDQMDKLNEIANSIPGITKGYEQIQRLLSKGVITLSVNGKKQIYNADQLLRIYALSKNDVQRQKLNNMGFTESKLNEVKDILGPEVTEFADKLVDYFSNDYFESVNDIYKDVNYVNLGYVPNYFPTMSIATKVDGKLLEDGNFNGIFNAESSPSFRERTDQTSDVDLGPAFTDVVESHFQAMEKYKAYAKGVKKLNALFNVPAVNTLLEETGMKRTLKTAVNFAVNPNAGLKSQQSFLTKAMTKFTGFALSFKLIQIAKQATSFIQAYDEYQFLKDRKVPGLDTLMFMLDSAYVMATLPIQVRKAYKISANFKDRLSKGLEGDVYGLESGSQIFRPLKKSKSLTARLVRLLKTLAGMPTVIGDVLGVMGYMTNYNRNIKNGMSEEDALEAFNNYNATLQTRRATEKIPLQQSQNELTRAFTMFGSTAFLQLNKVAQAQKAIMRSLKQGKVPTGKDLRSLAINLSIANMLFTLVSVLPKFIKGDDEDKEQAWKMMKDAALGLNILYTIPLVGAGAEVMIAKMRGEKTRNADNVVNPYTGAFRKIERMMKEGESESYAAARTIAEMVLGTQLDPFIAVGNMFAKDGVTDENLYDLVGISPSYRPEEKKSISKEEMKEYMPEIYDSLYGEEGIFYEQEERKKELNEELRMLEKEKKDLEFGAEPEEGVETYDELYGPVEDKDARIQELKDEIKKIKEEEEKTTEEFIPAK